MRHQKANLLKGSPQRQSQRIITDDIVIEVEKKHKRKEYLITYFINTTFQICICINDEKELKIETSCEL